MARYTIIVEDLTATDIETEKFEYYPAIDVEDFMSLNNETLESLKPIDLWEVMCRLYAEWLRENYWSMIEDFSL